jgi:hypothetical protein
LQRDFAEDIVQQFVMEKILIKNILSGADRSLGRFRSYLVQVLTRYVIDELRRRKRREGGYVDVSYADELADGVGADERNFDDAWANQILQRALSDMEEDCGSNADVWRVFRARVLGPAYHDIPPIPYNDLVKQLDIKTPRQAINLLVTAKRKLERHVRTQIAAHASEASAVDQDFLDFCQLLSR